MDTWCCQNLLFHLNTLLHYQLVKFWTPHKPKPSSWIWRIYLNITYMEEITLHKKHCLYVRQLDPKLNNARHHFTEASLLNWWQCSILNVTSFLSSRIHLKYNRRDKKAILTIKKEIDHKKQEQNPIYRKHWLLMAFLKMNMKVWK